MTVSVIMSCATDAVGWINAKKRGNRGASDALLKIHTDTYKNSAINIALLLFNADGGT